MSTAPEPLVASCPPCEDPAGHQYDDDRSSIMYGLTDWSRIGDPCIWCDHEKCSACPPPRGETFAVLHERGEEECWALLCNLPQCVRYRASLDAEGGSWWRDDAQRGASDTQTSTQPKADGS